MENKSIYDFTVKNIHGEDIDFNTFRGKTLLIVNTASFCGFTPQYIGLNNLYNEFKDRGFIVLGFPCNQFGNQEPGNEEMIIEYCTTNYKIDFPLFQKIDVNGSKAHPLYKYLRKKAPGILNTSIIKWNFTKFLVNKDGKVVKRFASIDKPEQLIPHIENII